MQNNFILLVTTKFPRAPHKNLELAGQIISNLTGDEAFWMNMS